MTLSDPFFKIITLGTITISSGTDFAYVNCTLTQYNPTLKLQRIALPWYPPANTHDTEIFG